MRPMFRSAKKRRANYRKNREVLYFLTLTRKAAANQKDFRLRKPTKVAGVVRIIPRSTVLGILSLERVEKIELGAMGLFLPLRSSSS